MPSATPWRYPARDASGPSPRPLGMRLPGAPRILLIAALVTVATLTAGCAGRQIACIDPVPVRAARSFVPIVDAATGAPLRDAAVWRCDRGFEPPGDSAGPEFVWFGSRLITDASEPLGPDYCAVVSHPGYQAVEVYGEGGRCGLFGPRRVAEIRLRPVRREAGPFDGDRPPADRAWLEASGGGGATEEITDPLAPNLPAPVVAAVRAQGLVPERPQPRGEDGLDVWPPHVAVIRPVEGEFDAVGDPRLAALALRADVEGVGWVSSDGAFCGNTLDLTFDRALGDAQIRAAVERAGNVSIQPHPVVIRPGYYRGFLQVGVGMHRGAVERARQLARRLPPGSAVGFACRRPEVYSLHDDGPDSGPPSPR